jgi:hypothetical protein
VPAPDLPAGTIEVTLHDAMQAPLPNIAVSLGGLHQDPATGDSTTKYEGKTDLAGMASFRGLPTGSSYSYRATVSRDGATFASEPLRLDDSGGKRALLHVYPVTRNIRQALVGMRAVLLVQPREDVFQIEASFRVFNIGATAWLPDGVRFELPTGAKAFRAQESMRDARIEKTSSGAVELRGTFTPGQHDLGFQFQVANDQTRTRTLHVALPPHVAELRVISEGPRGMTLAVEGFPDAEPTRGQDGGRLLVTGRRMAQGERALDAITIVLGGIPVPSDGRWYAALLAGAIALFGFAQAFARRPVETKARTGETEEALGLLLDELVTLERLRREDRVGPRTYQATRSDLLDAVARLEAHRLALP